MPSSLDKAATPDSAQTVPTRGDSTPSMTPPIELSPKARMIVNAWHQIGPLLLLILAMCCVRSSLADWNDVPTGSMKPTILEGDRIFVNKLAYDFKLPLYSNEGWVIAIYAAVAVLPVVAWALLPSLGIRRPKLRGQALVIAGLVVLALVYIGHWICFPSSPNWIVAKWGEPKQGEIVVFLHPDTGTRLVKRCIGVPGDTVELRDNVLWVNGVESGYADLDPKYRAQMDAKDRADFVYREETMPGGRKHPVLASLQLQPRDWGRRTFGPVKLGVNQYFMMGDNRDNSGDSRFFLTPVTRDLILGRSTAVAFSLNYENHWIPRWARFFSKMP